MNAVLEAPILAEEVEPASQDSLESQGADQNLAVTSTIFADVEHISKEESLPDSATVAPDGSRNFRLHRSRGANVSHQDGEEAAPSFSLAQSGTPQPRAVLREEFDVLYHTYERRVYRQCYRMLGNQEDAEDLTQEVFLQLFRKADTFRGEASFSTWLHRLTINTVLMQMRRFRRWRGSVTSLDAAQNTEDGANEFPAAVSSLPAPATSPMDKISLDVAIDKLSSGYKEIFLLHDLEGYRHDEIAKRLGISEGTSKSQLHKARLRMRDLVQFGGHRWNKAGVRCRVSGVRRK